MANDGLDLEAAVSPKAAGITVWLSSWSDEQDESMVIEQLQQSNISVLQEDQQQGAAQCWVISTCCARAIQQRRIQHLLQQAEAAGKPVVVIAGSRASAVNHALGKHVQFLGILELQALHDMIKASITAQQRVADGTVEAQLPRDSQQLGIGTRLTQEGMLQHLDDTQLHQAAGEESTEPVMLQDARLSSLSDHRASLDSRASCTSQESVVAAGNNSQEVATSQLKQTPGTRRLGHQARQHVSCTQAQLVGWFDVFLCLAALVAMVALSASGMMQLWRSMQELK